MKNNGNTFGTNFSVTTFGESHGVALGCIIDGCPAGIELSEEIIQKALNRRRPGVSPDGKLNVAAPAGNRPETGRSRRACRRCRDRPASSPRRGRRSDAALCAF